jgi:hypothetical protein
MKKEIKRVEADVKVVQTDELQKSVAKELTVEDKDMDQILNESEERRDEDTE